MEIIHVNLSELERRRIDQLRYAVGEGDEASRALWDIEDERKFKMGFDSYRRGCFLPYNVNNMAQFLDDHNRIGMLYQSKRIGDLCPICVESERLDSITRCSHTFCGSCFRTWYQFRWAIHVEQRLGPPYCPMCKTVVRRPDRELVSPSSKMKAVISRAQTFLESNRPFSKLVILSSCLGTLLWLHSALQGLNILNVYVVDSEDLTSHVLNTFLHSQFLHVLLVPIHAVQFQISLPPGSMVIVAEAIVADVMFYLLRCLPSFPIPYSVNYVSLVSRGTVEEVIADVPMLPDAFDSFDQDHVFIGPVFSNVDRLLAILQAADHLDHDLNDAED